MTDRLGLGFLAALVLSGVAAAGPPAGAFTETGVASWYGEAFHGKKTASGEFFDMHAMTAAHKSLPFGTLVTVTSIADGRSVVVRINDRGPFVAGRIIDLSKAAAVSIGLDRSGTALVEIRIAPAFPDAALRPGTQATAPVGMATTVRIQVGSYRDSNNAATALESLARLGLSGAIELAGPYHRVVIYATASDKRDVEAKLDGAGWKDRLVTEVRR